jgi:TPR repeat protein
LSTNNVPILLALADVYDDLQDKARSAEYLERAINLGAARNSPKLKAEFETLATINRAANAGPADEQSLRARAASGDLGARMVLANLLFKQGLNNDALELLLEGAKKGDPHFQENYGRNVYVLKGDSRAAEAVEWLRKAALQQNSRACHLLSVILYAGKGIPKDEREASLWAHVGDAKGEKDCRSLLKEMQLFANSAALAEGKKQAEEFLAGNGKAKTAQQAQGQ